MAKKWFTYCYYLAMKMFCLIGYSFFLLPLSAQTVTNPQYKDDFDYFWKTINDIYCYWDKKQTDWNKVKTVYGPMMDTVATKSSFILLLEKIINELYDHHASLNTNTPESQKLVPSGTDIWAEYVNNKPIITEIRAGSGADMAGMKAGMEIIAINDIPVEKAILPFSPQCVRKPDNESKNYALRQALAGKHSDNRKIAADYQSREQVFYPDHPVNLLKVNSDNTELLRSRIIDNNIGYILINNALGNNDLIPVFDSALGELSSTRAMIIDLRNTPGGGNTTVARSIIGRFITKEGFYQKHEFPAEENQYGIKRSWLEIASPKKPVYTKPLVILVDHWTGSVGEGIAIGFDALKRARIIGTPMAGLNGAIYSYTMPYAQIGFSFPAEKLFHVNGTPREKFQPSINVDMAEKKNEDYILQEAVKYLRKLVNRD